jgi:hypothetical protein
MVFWSNIEQENPSLRRYYVCISSDENVRELADSGSKKMGDSGGLSIRSKIGLLTIVPGNSTRRKTFKNLALSRSYNSQITKNKNIHTV